MKNAETYDLDHALMELLNQLSPHSRRHLIREIARDLRKTQQKQVAAQANPDGSPFIPRKARYITLQRGMKFIWRGEARSLKNWQLRKGRRGTLYTGFDLQRNAIRSFYRRDISRFIEIKTQRIKTRLKNRQSRMFKKLVTNRYLLTRASPDEATLTFAPQVVHLARVHHYGLKDRVAPGVEVQYPARQLLGFTPADLRHIEYQIISWLSMS